MIAVDTNIVVRFLTKDDEPQFKKALALFKRHDIFIPDSVVLECEWVLRYAYEFDSASICKAFRKLFGLTNVHLSNATLIAQAIEWYELGLDFSDALHLTLCQQHDQLFSFDDKFISRSKGLSNCVVLKP